MLKIILCLFSAGWTGPTCKQPVCIGCSEHGTCVSPGQCRYCSEPGTCVSLGQCRYCLVSMEPVSGPMGQGDTTLRGRNEGVKAWDAVALVKIQIQIQIIYFPTNAYSKIMCKCIVDNNVSSYYNKCWWANK